MGHAYPSAMFYPVISSLSEQCHVICFDKRGTGLSGATRHASVSDLALGARAVVATPQPLTPLLTRCRWARVWRCSWPSRHLRGFEPWRWGCPGLRVADPARLGQIRRFEYRLPLRFLRSSFRSGCGSAAATGAVERPRPADEREDVRTGVLGQHEAS